MIATHTICLIFTIFSWKQYESFYPCKTCGMWLLSKFKMNFISTKKNSKNPCTCQPSMFGCMWVIKFVLGAQKGLMVENMWILMVKIGYK